MDEFLQDFLSESNELLAQVEKLLVEFRQKPADLSLIGPIFRHVHTIKGTSSFLDLKRLTSVAHVAETLLGRMRDGETPTEESVSLVLASIDHIRDLISDIEHAGAEPPGDSSGVIRALEEYLSRGTEATHTKDMTETVEFARDSNTNLAAPGTGKSNSGSVTFADSLKVSVETIERMMQLVSELVLARNRLIDLSRHDERETLKIAVQRLSGLTSDLQDVVMRARMQPISKVFANFPRMVRELCRNLNKKIDIEIIGGETELDRHLIEVVRDPLTHIIRNSADHGIEFPDMRVKSGKTEHGIIRVHAYHDAGQFAIDISDDGAGISTEVVKKKAVASGLIRESEVEKLTDDEVYKFIFEPGLSTAQSVTNVSGRGVGMEVVRSNVESVRGSVSLSSERGRGTQFMIRIPLTLAITSALIVEAGGLQFAIPQYCVAEVVEAAPEGRAVLRALQGKLLVEVRGAVIPAISLTAVLDPAALQSEVFKDKLVIVLNTSGFQIGLVVDAIVDMHEIVVKPMNRLLERIDLFSGQTILGDGSVLLIIDPAGLARRLKIGVARRAARNDKSAEAGRIKTRLIMFSAGGGVSKVFPTSIVTRIEQIKSADIQRAASGHLMTFQEGLIPILPIGELALDFEEAKPVIVISINSRQFGLLVDRIDDIVEHEVNIEIRDVAGGSIGTCRINGEVVDVVDPTAFLRQVDSLSAGKCAASGKNVLIFTGDSRAIDLLAPAIQAAGYSVATALSAASARSLCSSPSAVDVVLMDLNSIPVEDACGGLSDWVGGRPVIGLIAGPNLSAASDIARLQLRATTDPYNRVELLNAIEKSFSAA